MGIGIQYLLSCVVLMCFLVVFHLPYAEMVSQTILAPPIDIVLHRASCTQSIERFLIKTLYSDLLASEISYIIKDKLVK